jgi:hypothetical protein
VAAGDGYVPDWRDAAAYEPLLAGDRSLFAWEWLRRNSGYRAAVTEVGEAPQNWGLHDFLRPEVTVPEARPIWRAEVDPFVLPVEAVPSKGGDAFSPEPFADMTNVVTGGDGREYLLISDGFRAIRIDVLAGSVMGGPAELRYRIQGLAAAERPTLTLRRLLALWRAGRFCRSLHPREARARRRLLMLRAHDALSAGADQREIATALLSPRAGRPRWRTEVPSIRSRAQRLVRSACAMEAGGFWALLAGGS